VNAILNVPLPLRLAALVLLGLAAGSAINWAIYALAWLTRPISPWQHKAPDAPPRRWHDFLPVLGWLGLRREAAIHGRGFWVRPLAIELACGIGLAVLYWWEVTGHLAPPVPGVAPATPTMLHLNFASHAILLAFMLVATFIDFDEQTIPDGVTIPGTLIGLALAALWPLSHLPVIRTIPPLGAKAYGPLLLTSTDDWPAWLDTWHGLAVASIAFLAWCAALIPATVTLRRGWMMGVRFYIASILRRSHWLPLMVIALAGLCVIGSVWLLGGSSWQALLTSITGLAFGGGLIWAVRIVGQVALGKEAMGFGDVTLMAMIGSFLGWQACLIVFFLSPFAALIIAVTQWVLTRRRDIAFGPYLCLAALFVIVKWADIWNFAAPIFALGWLVPAIVTVCLLLMLGLLMVWRIIEGLLFGERR
jgi:prepilin signal peptidase PulO-like enzyme (type II secretory pathway)